MSHPAFAFLLLVAVALLPQPAQATVGGAVPTSTDFLVLGLPFLAILIALRQPAREPVKKARLPGGTPFLRRLRTWFLA